MTSCASSGNNALQREVGTKDGSNQRDKSWHFDPAQWEVESEWYLDRTGKHERCVRQVYCIHLYIEEVPWSLLHGIKKPKF